jgi:hypothetical protein
MEFNLIWPKVKALCDGISAEPNRAQRSYWTVGNTAYFYFTEIKDAALLRRLNSSVTAVVILQCHKLDGSFLNLLPPTVTHVHIRSCDGITDNACNAISRNVTALSLFNLPKLTVHSLRNLPPGLTYLHASGFPMNDVGLGYLMHIPLQALYAEGKSVITEDGISRLPLTLVTLEFHRIQITDDAILGLSRLRDLLNLSIYWSTGFTGIGFGSLPALVTLELVECRVGNGAFAHSVFPNLELLDLTYTDMSDEDAKILSHKINSECKVNLTHCDITEAALRHLRSRAYINGHYKIPITNGCYKIADSGQCNDGGCIQCTYYCCDVDGQYCGNSQCNWCNYWGVVEKTEEPATRNA